MVFGQAPSPGFPKPQLLLEHRSGMLHLGSDMSLGTLHPLLYGPFSIIRQMAALPWPHGDTTVHLSFCHLLSLLKALVACIPIEHLLFSMQWLCCHPPITDMSRGGGHRVDQAGILIHPKRTFMPKNHWFPLRAWCICGSRSLFSFFVEVEAWIMVASGMLSLARSMGIKHLTPRP